MGILIFLKSYEKKSLLKHIMTIMMQSGKKMSNEFKLYRV